MSGRPTDVDPRAARRGRSTARITSVAIAPLIAALLVSDWTLAATLQAQATDSRGAAASPGLCRISGRVTSGNTSSLAIPLPGVSMIVRDGNRIVRATSTDAAGAWDITLPHGNYALEAELAGFDHDDRSLTVSAGSCTQTLDIQLSLRPPQSALPAGGTSDDAGRRDGGADSAAATSRFAVLVLRRSPGAERDVAPDTTALQGTTFTLPPGFSSEMPADTLAINGAATVDRGLLNDRRNALRRGEIAVPPAAMTAAPADTSPQSRTGGAPTQPRFARGRDTKQRLYSGTTSYTVAGSAFNAAPYQLRPDAPPADPDYVRQSVDFTVGGPLRIPGLYDGTRRTNLTLSYSGTRGGNLLDQYATVPTEAMRAGDLSSQGVTIIDPLTGQPFPGNQIPLARLSPAALALLQYIPLPNAAGSRRNFHESASLAAAQTNVNFRVRHDFTPAPVASQRAGPAGGRQAAAGRAASAAAANTRTTAALTWQVQYRSYDNERLNAFPSLTGTSSGSTLSIPVALNLTHRRVQHNMNVVYTRSISDSRNRYAFVTDIASAAGIQGAAADPFDWGVPTVSFGSLSGLNDLMPSHFLDTALSASYGWSRWIGKQRIRFGGDARRQLSSYQEDLNARGSFVFTGLYSGNDFADFLLGQPQQALVQYGPGTVHLSSRSASLYAQHEWWYGYYSFNTGVRWELTGPYEDDNGRMVNLDVTPDFTAAVPVLAGGTGPFSGTFPAALIKTDANNFMPRLGMAWQPSSGTTLRLGYSITYNTGLYPPIARRLVAQPPFAVTRTNIGTSDNPLALTTALTATGAPVANNYGIALDYSLGPVQTWNADLSRDFADVWTVSGGYTHVRGSNLDLFRAPNRGPDGLRIPGVQPFLWQSSEGSSRLHSGVVRLRRRNTRGIGGNLSYTAARSTDNASSIGGGQMVVAQDDRNLAAEWGRSSFDRRHDLAGNLNIELPFGPNRAWLNNGGKWAALLESWTATLTLTLQSGRPLTARVLSSATDVARGTNGTLRANYNSDSTSLDHPTIDRFFNTAAFSVPAPGTFGNSSRNIITGPGSKDMTAQFTRDISLGGTHAVSIQFRATNLLNLVNYGAVDTVVNSPTFGQVTSVRPLRAGQVNIRFRY